jgi:hypothetical protein
MNIRKTLASLAIAGTLVGGFASVASAQADPAPNPPAGQHHFTCETANDLLARIHQRIDAVTARIAKGEARVDQLRSEGKNDQADALARRIGTATDRLSKFEARLAKVEARVAEHCNADPNAITPSSDAPAQT